MRRRDFITLLGGTAAAWPLAARAQQTAGIRRVGMLINLSETDLEAQRLVTAFREGLTQLGWVEAEDIAPAFDAMKDRADALYVVGDALVISHRVQINTLALIARLPTTYVVREHVVAGGLMSYGPNFPDLFRRR